MKVGGLGHWVVVRFPSLKSSVNVSGSVPNRTGSPTVQSEVIPWLKR
jgi:hypothetical protein